jgi:hypothetical protein
LTAQLREPLVAHPEPLGLEAKQYQARACDVPANAKIEVAKAKPRIFFMVSSHRNKKANVLLPNVPGIDVNLPAEYRP